MIFIFKSKSKKKNDKDLVEKMKKKNRWIPQGSGGYECHHIDNTHVGNFFSYYHLYKVKIQF